MSRPTDPSEVAQQIADQSEPDWELASESTDNLAGMRLISEIASCFRDSDSASPKEPSLFQWRHLEVREAIGSGAFGKVYRTYDPVLKREVALKIQHEREDRPSSPDMVIAEARNMARTRHPNILAIHGADLVDGRVGIWSDLLTGSTLAVLLKARNRLAPAEFIDLALPIAQALALIHRRGVVHGDIKPANIMIQNDGTPVLMDFGAAREQGHRLAVTMGSPRYMAPEQFDERPTTTASDLFALGVVAYRSLSGRYPWKADSIEALEQAHDQTRPASLAGIPRRFRRLISELLRHDPELRPSADKLVETLEHLRAAPQRLRRRVAVSAVIGSLSLGLLTAISAFLTEQRARQREQVLRNVVVTALRAADPERTSGPTSIKVVYEHMAGNMEQALRDQPDALADMRLMVGDGLGSLGEKEAALTLLERLLQDLNPDSAGDAQRRSDAWLIISELRTDLQDLSGAEQAVRAALQETQRRTDPEGPKQRLVARNQLVKLLGQQGRWKEQLSTQVALLAARQELNGKNSLATAVDHHNLAIIYGRLGDYDPALQHELRAAELLQDNGDGDSLRLGFVMLGLAAIQIHQGDFIDAQHNLDKSQTIYAANLPPGHPSFIEIESEQARLWRRSGQYALAEPLLLKHIGQIGAESLAYQQKAMRNLAYIRISQERWEEAAALMQQLLDALAPTLLPLRSYFVAVQHYAWARMAAEDWQKATDAIDAALADLTSRQLTGSEPYRNLQSWRQVLKQSTGEGDA